MSKYVKIFSKALIICSIYFLLTYIARIDFIRSGYSDFSFNVMNMLTYKIKQKTDSSNILIVLFDDFFLKKNHLVNKYGEPLYGYNFPRKYIASVIKILDKNEKNKHVSPKALFIDYDFSFTMMPGGKELSKWDKELIDVLAHDRNYVIFIPEIYSFNFIKDSKNKKIRQMIKEKKIVFVSPSFFKNNDGNVKRYAPVVTIGDKKYENLILKMYRLDKNKSIVIDDKTLYSTDILFKGYDGSHSYWENVYKCGILDFVAKNFYRNKINGSFILLGSSYSFNNDKYEIFPFFSPVFNGVEILANAYETLVFFNGYIKIYTWKNVIIVYLLIVFLVVILENINERILKNNEYLEKINNPKKIKTRLKYRLLKKLLSEAVVIIALSFLVSIICLYVFKIWIDYMLIFLAFTVYDVLKNVSIKFFDFLKEKKIIVKER